MTHRNVTCRFSAILLESDCAILLRAALAETCLLCLVFTQLVPNIRSTRYFVASVFFCCLTRGRERGKRHSIKSAGIEAKLRARRLQTRNENIHGAYVKSQSPREKVKFSTGYVSRFHRISASCLCITLYPSYETHVRILVASNTYPLNVGSV